MRAAPGLRWLSSALLVLGLLRLFTFATHDPLWAYANQYDMARTSACLGLWPANQSGPVDTAHLSAPLNEYRLGGARSDACFPSTEVAVVAAAVWFEQLLSGDDDGVFHLGWLAAWKALLAMAVALSLHWGLRGLAGWQLALALWFAVVVVDPFNLLFLGGLYTEFGALLGGWLAIGSTVVLCGRQQPGLRSRWLPASGLAVGLLMLGAARMQHVLHPLLLLLAVAGFLRGSPGRQRVAAQGTVPQRWLLLVPAAVAVLVVALFQLHNQQDQAAIADANRMNSLFAAVLPSSPDPQRMTERIGLPAHCARLNHVSWYLHHGHEPLRECPELSEYSRLRALSALAMEPTAALRLVGRGLLQSSAWRLPYLGEVAGEVNARAPRASLAAPLAGMGFAPLAMLWLLPLFAALPAAWRLLRGNASIADLLASTLAGWIVLVWVASLLGDGYSELTRHLHLAQNALLAMWLWLLGSSLRELVALTTNASRRRMPALIPPVAVLAVAALLSLAWSALPMASGQIRTPGGNNPVRERFAVEGWVLAAKPVTQARALLGDTVVARFTLWPAGHALEQFFPVGNGRLVKAFSGEIVWPMGEQVTGNLHIEALEEGGTWTKIDAVQLRRDMGSSAAVPIDVTPSKEAMQPLEFTASPSG